MGFIVGLIVNAALLSIPIGGTLGTLFGIRPFENERVPEVIEHNGVSAQSVCNDLHDFHLFAQNKVGLNYTGEFYILKISSPWTDMSATIPCICSLMSLFCLLWIECLLITQLSELKRNIARKGLYLVCEYDDL